MKIRFSFPDQVVSNLDTGDYRDLTHLFNVLLCSHSEVMDYYYRHDPKEMALLVDVTVRSEFPTPQDALKAILPLGCEVLSEYLVSD